MKFYVRPPLISDKTQENTSTYYDFRGANFPSTANFDKNYIPSHI